jgi:hypothetical protein
MILLLWLGAIGFVIVAPAAGWMAASWGFNTYPRTTGILLLALFVVLVLAALSFNHFFPYCHAYLRGGVTC